MDCFCESSLHIYPTTLDHALNRLSTSPSIDSFKDVIAALKRTTIPLAPIATMIAQRLGDAAAKFPDTVPVQDILELAEQLTELGAEKKVILLPVQLYIWIAKYFTRIGEFAASFYLMAQFVPSPPLEVHLRPLPADQGVYQGLVCQPSVEKRNVMIEIMKECLKYIA